MFITLVMGTLHHIKNSWCKTLWWLHPTKTRMCWSCAKDTWYKIKKTKKWKEAWNTVWWGKNSGKGRLTDKIINKMQNYYGVAIRQNPGQLVTWNQKRYCSSVMALPRHTRSWR